MSVKLIIFDLDGTLVDTIRDITSALNHALRANGFRGLSVEDTKKMVGEGITRLIEKLLGQAKAEQRDVVIQAFLDYYAQHLVDSSEVYPHVREILARLAGFKKAVISNKRENLSRKILERLKLLSYFDIVVGSDTTSEKKPSPLPVIHVLTKIGVYAHESLIVGDSNYDIEAGKQAGISTVAVTYGYRERQYLLSADHIIDRFDQLPGILDIIS